MENHFPNSEKLVDWIRERHAIYQRKLTMNRKPWTTDKILQQYRFCNVYRELDTVTKWIAKHWRQPHIGDPDLWFAMVIARFINWPETLEAIGYPVPWDRKKFINTCNNRQDSGMKVFTGAYMIHAAPSVWRTKATYLAMDVFQPMWEAREKIRPKRHETLQEFYDKLSSYQDMGSFMTGQVIADLKYATLASAKDWGTWAVAGPGSKRGLNRVMGRPKHEHWTDSKWKAALDDLKDIVDRKVQIHHLPAIHAQDLQNCLCEFDKYERVRLGEGKPRSKYPGV